MTRLNLDINTTNVPKTLREIAGRVEMFAVLLEKAKGGRVKILLEVEEDEKK